MAKNNTYQLSLTVDDHSEDLFDVFSDNLSGDVSGNLSDDLSDYFFDDLSGDLYDHFSDGLSNNLSGDISDYLSDNLTPFPVTLTTFPITFLCFRRAFQRPSGKLSDDLSLVSEQASSSSPPVSCSSALFLNIKQTTL
jgi:hypothetical protein